MARNSTPQRRIERMPWRPGLWIGESGAAMPVKPNPENGICIYAIEYTMLVIARAMVEQPDDNPSKDNQ